MCDIKMSWNSQKCPQYHLIGYVRLKNSSITEKSLWSMDLKSGHDLDGWWIDDGLTYGWLFCAVLLAYLLYAVWVFRIIKYDSKSYTYEVILEVGMHVINAIIHDSRCNALAGVTQRPRRFHVQIKLRYSTSLTSIVLHIKLANSTATDAQT